MSSYAMPTGKGMYVHQIKSWGSPAEFVEFMVSMDIDWIALKLSDGANRYNLRRTIDGKYVDDIIAPFVEYCRRSGIILGGWGYVYGSDPEAEARRALDVISRYEPSFWLIDAEGEYNGKTPQAVKYMSTIRKANKGIPIALSSYRFPLKFPAFPFAEFLYDCDFNAPQVYYNRGRAAQELDECIDEYKKYGSHEVIPAGRAYWGEGFPMLLPHEPVGFMRHGLDLGLKAAFFWSADFLWKNRTAAADIIEPIGAFDWTTGTIPEPEPKPEPERELSANIYIDGVGRYVGKLKFVNKT